MTLSLNSLISHVSRNFLSMPLIQYRLWFFVKETSEMIDEISQARNLIRWDWSDKDKRYLNFFLSPNFFLSRSFSMRWNQKSVEIAFPYIFLYQMRPKDGWNVYIFYPMRSQGVWIHHCISNEPLPTLLPHVIYECRKLVFALTLPTGLLQPLPTGPSSQRVFEHIIEISWKLSWL